MIAVPNHHYWDLEDDNPNALLADGFEDAYLGYTANVGHPSVAVYDLGKCLEILMASGMTEEEATDYLHASVLCAYVGLDGPLFVRMA